MRGSTTSGRASAGMKTFITDAKNKQNVSIPSQEKMTTLFNALGAYYKNEKQEELNEGEKMALFMYLTEFYGRYRLSDC